MKTIQNFLTQVFGLKRNTTQVCSICGLGSRKGKVIFDADLQCDTHSNCSLAKNMAIFLRAGFDQQAAAFLKISQQFGVPAEARISMKLVKQILYATRQPLHQSIIDLQVFHVEELASKMNIAEAWALVWKISFKSVSDDIAKIRCLEGKV